MRGGSRAALLLLAAVAVQSCAGFKAEEFKVRAMHSAHCAGCDDQPIALPLAAQRLLPSPSLQQKCADSAFCTRLRGNTSEAFVIVPESVQVQGPRVTASVRNTADANGTFALVLTAYGDTLRLFVNEEPDKGRFQVPDVLVPGLEQREQVRGRAGAACAGAVALTAGRLDKRTAPLTALRHRPAASRNCHSRPRPAASPVVRRRRRHCASTADALPTLPRPRRAPPAPASAALGGGEEGLHQAEAAGGRGRGGAALCSRPAGGVAGRPAGARVERRQAVHFRAPPGEAGGGPAAAW